MNAQIEVIGDFRRYKETVGAVKGVKGDALVMVGLVDAEPSGG
jgi:hypothetical protein